MNPKIASSIDEKMVKKYSQNAFMYVEYPHKSFWSNQFSEQDFKEGLKSLLASQKDAPILLYVHMPYCQKQCYFCTCRVEISLNYEDVKHYLNVLYREIDLYQKFFKENSMKPNIKEIHLGGGSPTFIYPAEFDQLIEKLKTIADIENLAEFSIEIDPRRVKKDRLDYYHNKGINRISFGIQDFDLEVQKAVNRVQPASLIEKILTPEVRKNFKNGVNFDIICGLPRQTVSSMKKTMEKVSELSPDRICLNYLDFSPKYAEHQLLMPQSEIPVGYERKRIFLEALDVLTKNGYVRTGYDHFAKPTDEVAKAMAKKKMAWNSLGYTPGRCVDIIGIGVHSYSRLGENFYTQNAYELEEYEFLVHQGKFPVFRGHKLNQDDVIRRDVIQQLRSYFFLDFSEIENKYQINFNEYFKNELRSLAEFEKDGIVELNAKSITITPIGHQFANLICKNFDQYLHSRETSSQNSNHNSIQSSCINQVTGS
ncbi:MAG: oxygen-independent coproporphyrinogen III oxidase [Elusimicrobia bacterium]|nr:oxygen-independent coproporphyrinogen III oxidase [Elusimicrobiota bacterium]